MATEIVYFGSVARLSFFHQGSLALPRLRQNAFAFDFAGLHPKVEVARLHGFCLYRQNTAM
jgi:hypothetical protein